MNCDSFVLILVVVDDGLVHRLVATKIEQVQKS